MIRVILWRNKTERTGFRVSGHAGFAPAGQDIVCAAVSSAVRLAEGILSSMQAEYTAEIDRERNAVTVKTRESTVLDGFARLMRELSEEYPEYIQVTEVRYV